ncbi:glycosyltransferase family 2 protein [Gimibacter soli]|uniref:Uncharacterized protein n=1 Tax=Gimibacter soli TaxID=3024400 RepID=A0AAE9XMS0_9PROT|nr:hypothetical protein [Gimibacter soli]WCL53051.1 hypothetical protein PH603_10920 [Gimibacter soli]
MLVDIIVKGFNRPHCLDRLASSIAAQRAGSLQIRSIRLFLDGPRSAVDEAGLVAECARVFQGWLPVSEIVTAPHNLGPNGNCERAWLSAVESDADAVLMFEDDLELSPHYFHAMSRLLEFAQSSSQVGMVSAHGMLGAPYERMKVRASAILPMSYMWGIHRWGIGMTRDVCRRLAPVILAYFSHARNIGHRSDNCENEQVRQDMFAWLGKHGFYQDYQMHGYDAAYDLAAYLTGCVHLNTYGVFAKSTGMEGTSFGEEAFRKYRYDLTRWLDAPPEAWGFPSEAKLHGLVELVRSFHIGHSLRANMKNSPLPPLTVPPSRIQFLTDLYANFYGWTVDDEDIVAHRMMHLVSV